MIPKFLDPKNDYAFKRLFGTKKNKDILIHFLNDMIDFKDDGPITDITFLKTSQDPDIAAKKTSIVDKWCYFFKHAQETSKEELAKIVENDEIIERAYEELDQFSWGDQALMIYEEAEKKEDDLVAAFDQKFDEGMEKGMEKGKEEGLKEGELKKSLEIAHAMKTKGINLDLIASLTRLPLDLLKKRDLRAMCYRHHIFSPLVFVSPHSPDLSA